MDRIVLLRVCAVIVLLAFLGLIVKGATIAFGSGERRALQIDRAVGPTSRPAPDAPR